MDSRFPSCSGKARTKSSGPRPGRSRPISAGPIESRRAAPSPTSCRVSPPRRGIAPLPGRPEEEEEGRGPVSGEYRHPAGNPTQGPHLRFADGADGSRPGARHPQGDDVQHMPLSKAGAGAGASCHDAHRVDSGRSVRAPIGDTEKACRLPSSLPTHPHIRGRPPGFRPCAGYRADYGSRFDAAVLGVARSQVVDHGSTSLHAV